MEYTVEHAQRILDVIDVGLVAGLGNPVPGQMCVEAAICYSLGLSHSDDPGCVSDAVRSFKIRLNDAHWSSPAARAKGLRALAIAQLGSRGVVNNGEFTGRIIEATIRKILPIGLRTSARLNPMFAVLLESAAIRCELEGSNNAANVAAAYANAAYANATTNASYAYTTYAADGAANVADAGNPAARAVVVAIDVAYAVNAADGALVVGTTSDSILSKSAALAFDVLRSMGAPGVVLWDAVNARS